jgi:hypothetical protein
MDLRLAIGCTLAVIAIGIAVYEWAQWMERRNILPPPKDDTRDSLREWRRFWQETRRS